MRVGIRPGLTLGKICRVLLLGTASIALVTSGINMAFGENTAKALGVYTSSPVELVLTDPQGRRTGFDPTTNTLFEDIPTSSYSKSQLCDESGSGGCQAPFKSLDMANPMDGQYTLDVIGIGAGDFTVEVRISDVTGNWITQTYSGTTAPGNVSRFTFPGEAIIFTTISARMKVNSASTGFDVNGTFSLGPGGAISPVTQPVTIETFYSGHSFLETIPAGSFSQSPQGTFVFTGVIQGVQLAAELTPAGGQTYIYHVSATGVQDPELPNGNPVNFRLAIGNDGGSMDVNAEFTP